MVLVQGYYCITVDRKNSHWKLLLNWKSTRREEWKIFYVKKN